MDRHHFIIIGNGPSGNQAALTLRELDANARITLISRHPGGCYRPHLLPRVISGDISEDQIYLYSPSSYKDNDINFRKGQEVVGVNLKRHELVLDHKEILKFDGLIIAVGGKPRIPEDLSVFSDVMYTLKNLRDARRWKEKLKYSDAVLMIGGDLTSFSFTKVLLSMGKKVFFMINEHAFWPLRFNEILFEEASERLNQLGARVLMDSKINSISVLADDAIDVTVGHHSVRVGMIGAFFGLSPDIRFLAKSGLKIDRGILVDEYLNAGFESVFATGDCAQIYHPEIRDYWVSIGHDNAVVLGKIAAMNLVGAKVRTDVPKESVFNVQGVNVNTSWWTEF